MNYPYPNAASLRRAMPWQPHPLTGIGLERVAYHEAGHVVYLEWLGWPCVSAQAMPERGVVQLRPLPQDLADPDDPSGVLTASAAALYHAGTCAELLHANAHWNGPVRRPLQPDHLAAEAMLAPTFGCHHSGAHAFAQRVALHVLAQHWTRVCVVAARLVKDGRWSHEWSHGNPID